MSTRTLDPPTAHHWNDLAVAFTNRKPPDLYRYAFYNNGGAAVTLKGFFVDANGGQCGSDVSLSVPNDSNGHTLLSLYQATSAGSGATVFPIGTDAIGNVTQAVGFVGNLSGTVYFTLLGGLDGTPGTAPAAIANLPAFAASTYFTLGRA